MTALDRLGLLSAMDALTARVEALPDDMAAHVELGVVLAALDVIKAAQRNPGRSDAERRQIAETCLAILDARFPASGRPDGVAVEMLTERLGRELGVQAVTCAG